jgi:DNA-binding NarL/FixJ family response regulator
MISNTNKILIVEDCNIIADAYKNILNELPEINFKINHASNCDEAVQKIQTLKFNIALLDLQLPISKNERFICGEDIGLLIRKTSPETKIIVLTSITDPIRILNIINEFNPEGFMIKSDIDSKELKNSIKEILNESIYYSKTIKNFTKVLYNTNIQIDDFDRQILYHLSMGEKTKNLTKYVALSTRAIEVRKTKLKNLLDTQNDNNFSLVKAAKNLGII